jgi:hypothetical protein
MMNINKYFLFIQYQLCEFDTKIQSEYPKYAAVRFT